MLFLTTVGRPVAESMLLAGLLVGIWEFGDLVFEPRWRYGSLVATGILVPLALGWLLAMRVVPVPWAVLAITLLVSWMWLPRGWGAATTGLLMGMWVLVVGGLGDQPHKALLGAGSLMVLGLLAPVARQHQPRRWLWWMALYVVGIVVVIAASGMNGDSGSDAVISVIVGVFAGIYAQGHAARTLEWDTTQRQAYEDALTGAMTRYGAQAWRSALPPDQTHGMVVACDIDDFKWFNDMWGHSAGDEVLKEVVRRFRTVVRPQDAVVRPGGDEFLLWLVGVDQEQAPIIAGRIHHAVSGVPLLLREQYNDVGCSMGWAVGEFSDSLAEQADQALLTAKRLGKNQVIGPDLAPGIQAVEEPGLSLKVLTHVAEALWAKWEDAAVMTDDAGRIVSCNATFERLSGRSSQELRAQKPGLNSAGQTPVEIYQEMWRRLNLHEPWRGILLNQRPDQTTWWAYDEIWPIDCGQRTIGYWARVRDAMTVPAMNRQTPSAQWDALTVSPVFQPIVTVGDARPWGYEALIRPQLNGVSLPPDTLFSLAEASDSVLFVDRRCLESVASVLRDAGLPRETDIISLNVRSATLAEPQWLNDFLDHFPIPRAQVIVEICEKDLRPENFPSWEALRQAYPGVHWALDDWGAGQNDIERLMKVTPDWVKIDRSWLLLATDDADARSLLEGFCAWAERTGRGVIMEGVESRADVQLCQVLGIQNGQGYWWGRPAAWETFLNSSRMTQQ